MEKEKSKRFKCDMGRCKKSYKTKEELQRHKSKHKGCND